MIYEWKCKKCGEVQEVERRIANCNVPPLRCTTIGELTEEFFLDNGCTHDWIRVYSSSIPFQHLKQSGVFMDDNGNYAPRNT